MKTTSTTRARASWERESAMDNAKERNTPREALDGVGAPDGAPDIYLAHLARSMGTSRGIDGDSTVRQTIVEVANRIVVRDASLATRTALASA